MINIGVSVLFQLCFLWWYATF